MEIFSAFGTIHLSLSEVEVMMHTTLYDHVHIYNTFPVLDVVCPIINRHHSCQFGNVQDSSTCLFNREGVSVCALIHTCTNISPPQTSQSGELWSHRAIPKSPSVQAALAPHH